ncbi:SIS domain-containing protein [Ciceribacter azotifigens]|uniref:SIS domain-containing protein n=1 Tax=Ciceribacter azotifigens TaxID=2069303 RepID=UPI003A8910DA
MNKFQTDMAHETNETPAAVGRLIERSMQGILEVGQRIAGMAPPFVATCARGSSDHAAAYLKYALEIATGTPVVSIGPSIASIYEAPLRLSDVPLVTISQSGQSPDLLALQASAKASGALTIAVVNTEDSPVAREADIVISLDAGPERSVAATKSFVSSAVAVAGIVAGWTSDAALTRALIGLPEALDAALRVDWSALTPALMKRNSFYVVARGPTFPIAQEAALKSKETAALHAEAFSLAEVMHGPLALVRDSFPVLALLPEDRAARAGREALERLVAAGGNVFSASEQPAAGIHLPFASTGHSALDPLSMILSFYCLIEQVCRERGNDPDRPVNLRKVTETV